MLCPIAEGGMASVWVARLRGKRGFEKLVAIKTILPKFAQDARFERMFLDEAGLAARIEHANVAQVLDLGEEHDVLYLAMEFVDGDSLSKILRAAHKQGVTVPTGIMLRILADTCGGLHAAHEVRGRDGDLLHVVHRDVSPQNILVTTQGVAKLIDFGIAKARDRVSEDTSAGVLKGKIQFMAPEQAFGKPVDRRADIWAIGAILYFLLAGRTPFAAETEIQSLSLLSSGRPPPPLPPSVHPAVREIVQRALARDPAQRFANATEMQMAIEAAMVASNAVTTTAGVAAFIHEHMADRAQRRREGLDLALSAAAQREKVARMLERAGADSASGHGVPLLGIGTGPAPVVDATYATVLLGSSPVRFDPKGPSSTLQSARSEPSSETGESAMASSVLAAGLPRKLGGPVGVFVVALVAMLLVGAAIIVIARPNAATHSTSAARADVPPRGTVPPVAAVPAVPAGPSSSASGGASSGAATAAGSGASVPWTVLPPASVDTAPVPFPSAAPSPSPKAPPRSGAPPSPKPPSAPSTAAPKARVNDGF